MSRVSLENIQALSKQFIKAGFPFVKIELEADFRRMHYSPSRCDTCSGNGELRCTKCKGKGYIPARSTLPTPCHACLLRGFIPCPAEGCTRGFIGPDLRSELHTASWIHQQLSEEARGALEFASFYADGSCGSELTFTIPAERLDVILELMRVFYSIKGLTQFCDVRGSGIHIALLTSNRYPTSTKLPTAKLNNFKRQVIKLLPALYFLGASGSKTRSLEFRYPNIGSRDRRTVDGKYSAIFTKEDTVLEYRVFETCYEHPERIFEYLDIVAKTLEFYIHPRKKIKPYNHDFVLLSGNDLTRFYQDPISLQILDEQLEAYRPAWKTVDELKRERGFQNFTVKRLTRRLGVKESLFMENYKEARRVAKAPLYGDTEQLAWQAQEFLAMSPGEAGAHASSNPEKLRWEIFKALNGRPVRARVRI